MVGIDPFMYLEEKDDLKRYIYAEIAQEAIRIRERRDHSLAVDIANQVGKTFGG
jgi:hypothetical protein